jgi:hypothetical protein
METVCAFCRQAEGHEAGCPGDFRDEVVGVAMVGPPAAPSVISPIESAIETEVDGDAAKIVLNGKTGAPKSEPLIVVQQTPEESLRAIAKAQEQVALCEERLRPHAEALKAAKKDLDAAVARAVESYYRSRQLTLAGGIEF